MSEVASDNVQPAQPSGPYDAEYYASHCGQLPYERSQAHWAEFFGKIADELIRTFQPLRVFDAGCAHGFLVEALWDRGVQAYGRDISEFAISQVRADVRQFCSVGSLTDSISGPFDLIVCIEVLEHMTEEEGAKAVANMTAAADRIVFSSSPTDLTEPTHINVKPAIYWILLFHSYGFSPVTSITLPTITPYTLVFERSTALLTERDLILAAELVRARLLIVDRTNAAGLFSAQVAERDQKLTEAATEISQLARQIELDEANIAKLHIEVANRAAQCQAEQLAAKLALETVKRDLERTRVDYHAILMSTSWRATGLARSLARRLPPGLRRRLRQALRLVWRCLSFSLSAGIKARSELRRVSIPASEPEALSNGFDANWYIREYKDVRDAGIDPYSHYLNNGRAEGRLPNAMAAALRAKFHLADLCNPEGPEYGITAGDDAFRVSVLTPTYNTDPRFLRELFQTLQNQQYPNWEWVIVDDGSSRPSTVSTLRQIASEDPRVNLIVAQRNQGISGATNMALAAATGTYAALVDHDDLVARDAFLQIYRDWFERPGTQLFYTDECKLFPDGTLDQFWSKPDWSPAYLENTMCIGHLSVYEIEFLRSIGGFRSAFDGTQDYDMALRASLKKPKVRHLPIFAYVWRVIPGSAATSLEEKSYAIPRQAQAVLEYAQQKCPAADVVPGWGAGYWRIQFPLPAPIPLLSYVIPTGGGRRLVHGKMMDLVTQCILSFENAKFYPNREYVVVHNGNLTPQQLQELQAIPDLVLVHYDAPAFNFSEKLNLGVSKARGEYVCILNDDVAAITPRGGEELVSYLAHSDQVGAIGPLCLYENGTIQQNGVVLLAAAGPAHAGAGQASNFGGHQAMLRCRRESFVIGGAILFTKKSLYEEVGGFSEQLPLNYNDVDFCLKLRDRGYSCVVDPTIEVYHYEGATKTGTSFVEQERLFVNHPDLQDPYFSKWFDPSDPNFKPLLKPSASKELPFGPWLDRHIGRRAAELVPQGLVKLSVCVSVYNQSKRLLDEMYNSVFMQTYANKELVIVDNGSSNPETLKWLESTSTAGFAVISRVPENIGISGANRELLRIMTGDFFVAMDADDFLSVDALQMLAYQIERHPQKKLFYSDEYKSDLNSTRFAPFFKPDFDPILLMNCCYPAHLMAIERNFLKHIDAYGDDRATWCHDFDTLTRAMAVGEEPLHIRELVYAWRINPGSTASAETGTKPGTVASQVFVLDRLLKARKQDEVLRVEPNTLETSSGMWRLKTDRPVPNVKLLDAAAVWSDMTVDDLVSAGGEPGVEWLAILISPQDPQALLELSAIAWFDPRVMAVSGLLMEEDGRTLCWSGGLFLPGGAILDPYAGNLFASGGYHGQLWCQRCIDVPAPANILVRCTALRSAAARLDGRGGLDDLLTMLGLEAHENGQFIVTTPHLRAAMPRTALMVPVDRAGLLTQEPALESGSRWYDQRLDAQAPYTIAAVRSSRLQAGL